MKGITVLFLLLMSSSACFAADRHAQNQLAKANDYLIHQVKQQGETIKHMSTQVLPTTLAQNPPLQDHVNKVVNNDLRLPESPRARNTELQDMCKRNSLAIDQLKSYIKLDIVAKAW